ncbi:MAG: hypothetical protein P9X24_11960 [Candidatus Hatepunaea meridiana]|nr:hypothetical protein [Candidatus Hatepunaea meridiana]
MIYKELIIILRADLVPTLEERLKNRLSDAKKQNILKSSIDRYREEMRNYDAQLNKNKLKNNKTNRLYP